MTELTYTKNGDYRIPDLKLSEEPESKPLGKYGMLRKTYLATLSLAANQADYNE